MNEREVKVGDTYSDKVKKLIPAEVAAAYLAINSVIPLNSDFLIYAFGFFCLLVIICALYLYRLESVRNWMQVAFVSFIAFPVWALNISIARIDWMIDKEFLASCVLVIVTLFTPLIVPPRP